MRSFITGDDLANTVKMAHSQRRVAFLLVEGTTDAKFFQRLRIPTAAKFWLATGERMPCRPLSSWMKVARLGF